MYYLYIKTHNKTGLKYLGQTTKDPIKYRGSGKYWLRHISKHGNDVSTKILIKCETNDELKKYGTYYSEMWNIVESNAWANLVPETGQGGSNTPEMIEAARIRMLTNNPMSKMRTNKASFKKGNIPVITPERNAKIARGKRGSNNHYFGVPEAAERMNRKIECPNCGISTNYGNAKRWHFDNCRR
jgi:hypothetical protein